MINILVNGANGKMGQEVVKQSETMNFNVICGFDRNTDKENKFPVWKMGLNVRN